MAYGWYDSGSGNYFHQATLAANPAGAGYAYLYESDNWQGSASWSNKQILSIGYTSNFTQDYGWNSISEIVMGGHDLAANGWAAAGYTIDGTGYLRTFDGSAWSDVTSLGSAQRVCVARDSVNNLTLALFDQGTSGNLQFYNGTSVVPLMMDSTLVAGHTPGLEP